MIQVITFRKQCSQTHTTKSSGQRIWSFHFIRAKPGLFKSSTLSLRMSVSSPGRGYQSLFLSLMTDASFYFQQRRIPSFFSYSWPKDGRWCCLFCRCCEFPETLKGSGYIWTLKTCKTVLTFGASGITAEQTCLDMSGKILVNLPSL